MTVIELQYIQKNYNTLVFDSFVPLASSASMMRSTSMVFPFTGPAMSHNEGEAEVSQSLYRESSMGTAPLLTHVSLTRSASG